MTLFSLHACGSYVHRIGRTGRAGHMGIATSFYVPGYDPKNGNGAIAQQLQQQVCVESVSVCTANLGTGVH